MIDCLTRTVLKSPKWPETTFPSLKFWQSPNCIPSITRNLSILQAKRTCQLSVKRPNDTLRMQTSRPIPFYIRKICKTHLTLPESNSMTDENKRYNVIERLIRDLSPDNVYRHSSYLSITGGGSGSIPMLFATDVHENRRQRAAMGRFLQISRVIEPGDVVLSTHIAGGFYRYGFLPIDWPQW